MTPPCGSVRTELCSACLSRERRLTDVEPLQSIFGMLMGDFIKEDGESAPSSTAARLCWECAAVLRRVSEFKRRVHRAQHMLLRCCTQNEYERTAIEDTEFQLASMSQLKYSSKITFDFTFQNGETNLETADCKDEGLVKIEIAGTSDDEFSDQLNPIDVPNREYNKFTFPFSPSEIESDMFMGSEAKVKDVLLKYENVIEDSVACVEKSDRKRHFLNEPGPSESKARAAEGRGLRKAARMKRKKKKVTDKEESDVRVKKSDWKCRICGQSFSTRGKMTYHQRTVHADPVLCNECGRVFSFKPTLEKHMLTHFGGVPQYPCAICGKSFAGRAGVKSHMIHVHAAGGERHRCEPCDLTFKTKYKYRTHLKWSKRHGGEGTERHECEKCHRRYKTKQRLFEHFSYQHLGKAAHKCNICGKEISSLLSLQKHVKFVHEGQEKPRTHVCETCGDAFKQVSMLRQHQYIHSGERPYACDECGARFRQKGSLYTHRRLVHLKIKRTAAAAHT